MSNLIALLLCACVIGACSNIETPDLDADVRNEGIIPENWKPVPLRVGLAPFVASLDGLAKSQGLGPLPADEERLNRGESSLYMQMYEALKKYNMFISLEEIRGATPQMRETDLQRLAIEQGLDVVIMPKLLRHDVAYVDSNGLYGWNMFIWWMASPIISWFIADEDFEVNVHVQLQMYAVTGSNRALLQQRLAPDEKIVRSFDDFDEGFNLFSIYTTPRHFDESNWQRVGEKLLPVGDNEVKKAALRWIVNDLSREVKTESFQEKIRRRVALVIGVDGAAPLPLTRFATNDANRMQQHLAGAGAYGVAQGALKPEIGALVTKKSVLESANALAPLARGNDDVIVYFSGLGYVGEDGTPSLVLAQAGGGLERVTLPELLDVLTRNKPRTVTLVLDCSFTAPGDRRCASEKAVLDALVKDGVTGSLFDPVVKAVEERGTRCIILSASDAVIGTEMPALEIEELKNGLFTSFALQGLNGAADSDGTSGVTIEEFETWMRNRVTHIAQLEGKSQTGYYLTPDELKQFPLPTNTAGITRSSAGGE